MPGTLPEVCLRLHVLRRFVADGLPLDLLNSGQGSWHTSPSKITFAGSYAATLSHKDFMPLTRQPLNHKDFFQSVTAVLAAAVGGASLLT
jgi:hypothetical protein